MKLMKIILFVFGMTIILFSDKHHQSSKTALSIEYFENNFYLRKVFTAKPHDYPVKNL